VYEEPVNREEEEAVRSMEKTESELRKEVMALRGTLDA
jgi:hypothetical protein